MTLSIQNYLQSSPCARAVLYSGITVEVVYFAFLGLAHASLCCSSIKINGYSFIFDSLCSKTLLPWTSYMPEDAYRITVQGHYEMVVSKQPADVQDHLSDLILDEVRVGNT